MSKINFDDKLYNILNGNEKLLQFFINNGFDQLKNEKMLQTMGKMVSLNMALKVRGINKAAFEEKLNMFLNDEHSAVDKSLVEEKELKGDVIVKGVLPCPLKIPILEAFDKFIEDQKNNGLDIGYELKSANLGIDWIESDINSKDIDKVADVMISAGFELFFDKEKFSDFFKNENFYVEPREFNKDFDNEKICLRDPKNIYDIIAVVPCVFLVNENNLNGKEIPTSWEELLFSGNYDDSVAIPLSDLDMFNALVVTIFSKWGVEGIKALAKVYKKSLHPAEMVKKKGDSKNNPIISVTPYFFTQMVARSSALKVVWPKDGAIVSPVFLMAKKDNEKAKTVVEFFNNSSVGKLLSSNGKFPTTVKGVDNLLEENCGFLFCGWDYIHNNDIVKIMKESEKLFNEEILK